MCTSSSVDRTIRQWDARTGQCMQTWRGHQDVVLGFAATLDGGRVVTCGDDGVCLVFVREQQKSQ